MFFSFDPFISLDKGYIRQHWQSFIFLCSNLSSSEVGPVYFLSWKNLLKSEQVFRGLVVILRGQIISYGSTQVQERAGRCKCDKSKSFTERLSLLIWFCWTPCDFRYFTLCSTFMLLEQGWIPSYHACCYTGPRFLRSPSKDSSI